MCRRGRVQRYFRGSGSRSRWLIPWSRCPTSPSPSPPPHQGVCYPRNTHLPAHSFLARSSPLPSLIPSLPKYIIIFQNNQFPLLLLPSQPQLINKQSHNPSYFIIEMESQPKQERYKIFQDGGSGQWRSIEEYLSQSIPLTLYAGNLPKSWNEENIKDYFGSYGTIGKVSIISKYKKFTGAAFIEFSSVTDAEEAIVKLKNTTIPGGSGPVNIKWADTEEQRLGIRENEDHKLFIKSLPRKATSQSLQEVFSLIGDIDEISMEEGKWYAHIRFKAKESALRAIKLLSGQTFLHGSNIPIQVKFKDRKYVPEPVSKAIPDPLSMHQAQQQVFYEFFDQNVHYFYNCQTQKSQYQTPPSGATVVRRDGTTYIQQNQEQQKQFIGQKISGPPGANLFVYYLPNKMKNADLYNLFRRHGNILSSKVMSKEGVSRGYGFVNFDNVKSAREAMDELNGLELEGKKLKVELKKGAENNLTEQATKSLRQMDFNPF